jgi:hypothetical protein
MQAGAKYLILTLALITGIVNASTQALSSNVPHDESVAPENVIMNVTVWPSTRSIAIGEILTATVTFTYTASVDCSFSGYSVRLIHTGTPRPTFEYISSPILGPPAPVTSTYILQAVYTGTAILTAEVYGEEFCGYWMWRSYYGSSAPISVYAIRKFIYLPMVLR